MSCPDPGAGRDTPDRDASGPSADRLAAAREDGVLAERRRLSRELHDGLAQDLASLGYALDGVLAQAEVTDQTLAAELGGLRRELSGLLRGLRDDISLLRSAVTAFPSLGAAVRGLGEDLAERAGVAVEVDVQESGPRLPEQVEAELFRIAQQALTNAARHADARTIWVTCRVSPPSALVRVADDGRGISPPANRSDSYGFVILAERAQLVGASLSVRERNPTGTCVEVRLGRSAGRVGARRNHRNDGEHDDRNRSLDDTEPDPGGRPADR